MMKLSTMWCLIFAVLVIALLLLISGCKTAAIGYAVTNVHKHEDPPGVFVSLPIVPVEIGCQLQTHERQGVETFAGGLFGLGKEQRLQRLESGKQESRK